MPDRIEFAKTMNAETKTQTIESPVNMTIHQDEGIGRKVQTLPDRSNHSKRLSLNFPVLVSHHANATAQSPKTSTPISPVRSSPRPPSSPAIETPDFLTLLAGQERKVLELREELGKAENELAALKKQWASFEASKKKSELRQIAKLQPLPSATGKDDDEAEKERQRILEQTSGKPRRNTSQRVFSSSRHARQLSLLSPSTAEKPSIRHSIDGITSTPLPQEALDPAPQPLSRTTTMPIPTIESPQTLGKTYRDLAANRNSLPPPSTDAIMRHGKQMATDLKDGLWTFFEDIRQATVGEEAISGIKGENGRPKIVGKQRSANTLHRKKRFSKDRATPLVHVHDHEAITGPGTTKDTSFWREFGVDTPHKEATTNNRQVSDPLLDLDDEAWDAWESPQVQMRHSPVPLGPIIVTAGADHHVLTSPHM